MTLRNIAIGAVMACALIVSGCGTTTSDRAVSGGLLGAGAGAVVGSMTGSAVTGAVIGGVAGAAIGASTSHCDLDLGTPYWRDHGGSREYHRECDHHH